MRRSDDGRGATGPVTLRDVADRAGVSTATASRVLNGSDRVVKPHLAARVMEAAVELRYVSNGPAQALARSTTSTVGLIVHDVDDPYFSSIASGAMRVATRHRMLTMLASTFREPGHEVEYVRRFRAQRVRGLLLTGSGRVDDDGELRAALEEFADEGGRTALVSEHELPYDTVIPANTRGATQVARLLHDLGHTEVGVIGGPPELRTVQDRLRGFRETWAALGGTWDDTLLAHGDFSRAGGYSATLDLFERHPSTTAVFAVNDLMAVGTLAALTNELGRRVPQDVSVVGFDDLWFTADLAPSLTTVRLPLDAMGARAMEVVLDAPAASPRRLHFPAEVIVRGSTGPVSGRARR
jgi:LacI family transcriptional regulator